MKASVLPLLNSREDDVRRLKLEGTAAGGSIVGIT